MGAIADVAGEVGELDRTETGYSNQREEQNSEYQLEQTVHAIHNKDIHVLSVIIFSKKRKKVRQIHIEERRPSITLQRRPSPSK